MKNLIFPLLFTLISITTHAQSILGKWTSYDDKTKDKTAVIEIYKKSNKYYAKIVKSYKGESGALCDKCKGKKKNQPIVGLVIIEDMEKDGSKYEDGTIMDPESGDTYSCVLELVNNNKLKVRGYLGFSLLGRTQYWIKTK